MQDDRQLTHRAQESFPWSKEITKPYGELEQCFLAHSKAAQVGS